MISIRIKSCYTCTHETLDKMWRGFRSCASISSPVVTSLFSSICARGKSDTYTPTPAKIFSISHHMQMNNNKKKKTSISFSCLYVIDSRKQLHMNKMSLAIQPQGRTSNAICVLPSNWGALSHALAWQAHFVHALMFVRNEWNRSNLLFQPNNCQ